MDAPSPQPKVTIYGGPEAPNTYSPSPFVTKLEARLRFSNLSHKRTQGSFLKAPKGKIPYVALSPAREDGFGKEELLGDSTLITRRLIEDGALSDLNNGLDAAGRAQDLALSALLEDKIYFFQNHERWLRHLPAMRASLFASFPFPLNYAIGYFAYRANASALWGQGTSRFSADEVRSFHQEAWQAIEALLAAVRRQREPGHPFWILGGEGPTEADAAVYGFVVSELVCAGSPEGGKLVRTLPALMEYAAHIHGRYLPEYDIWE